MQEEFGQLIAELRADDTTVFLSSQPHRGGERLCDRVRIVEGKRCEAVNPAP